MTLDKGFLICKISNRNPYLTRLLHGVKTSKERVKTRTKSLHHEASTPCFLLGKKATKKSDLMGWRRGSSGRVPA
jgi:hypothetical protein